jgi:hypothetical protein
MTDDQISWKRITVEAVAIVASILLAFSIDAWWQERLEINEEVEQLARLHAEFVSNVERIGGYQTRLTGGQEATKEIFSRIQESRIGGSANLDVQTLLLYRMIDTPTFEPDTPVFDGLVRSG